MDKLLELLEKLVRALFGPGDKQDAEEVKPAPEPHDPPGAEAVTGWEGDPPYRYIDVSRWQGIIKLGDWVQVEAAGYKGVMLRAVGNRNGVPYIDPTFEDNYVNAKAAGLDVGVYYYTYATSEAMADAELALLRQAVYGKELTLPVAVDMEDETLAVLKPNDLTNLAAYHLEQIEKMGFFAQLYTYTSYANVHLDMARLSSRWDVWLADYTGKTPKVDFAYNAHQHTSKGSVPGITGNVDLNVTTLNYPKIIHKKGLTRLREGK
ncbi:MAG: glycosyl hydrolase family 25 [Bacteriophage sp.]|nr:MAG: glycosyl hydrolase family 25 [Bacteriophage sp.]